ncbi:MAG: sensor domain-containing diguanylate cyclase, partial [Comamonadaceae bacterium CG17_big_fil_post_rev_8_21_14_2_50_60_13]
MSEPKKSSATPEGTGAPLAAAAMRNAAEAALRERKAQSAPSLNAPSAEASQEMLHELQVHQIELEMQNEELQRKQLALDAANRRYFELYDLAPVGYCTLNEVGLIVQANLSASTMLGIERGALVKQPFSRFIFSDDMDSYYRLNKALQKGQIAPVVELRVLRKDAAPGWVQLMGNAYQDADGAAGLRLVLSDIGERKRQEQLRAETENKLQE